MNKLEKLEKQYAKCSRCLGTEFVEVEKKYICKNCGVEFTDETNGIF